MTNQQYQSLLQIMELIDGIESLVIIVISDTLRHVISDTPTRHFRHAHTSFQTRPHVISDTFKYHSALYSKAFKVIKNGVTVFNYI